MRLFEENRFRGVISTSRITKQILHIMESKVLSLKQACELLGYKKSYVYKMTSAGILPFSKPNGRKIFFDREKLENWMLGNASTSLKEKQIEAATYATTHK
ncbi:helix-turn-helix transcriptional regulator [Parasediminibacterium sp. JCM 36343]|uniref:helix-turn-helix transcriptional regulator n=1 Tax=Parasediminibacterium sp. JCM 36343 TaxID=3374279 RepID=UPI003979C93F